MEQICLTAQEVENFVKQYKEMYGWSCIARTGNKNYTDDTYKYIFLDDLGVSIVINPNNKGFSFSKSVGFVFQLKSNEFTPLDYQDHFIKNYLRFRKVVIDHNLFSE